MAQGTEEKLACELRVNGAKPLSSVTRQPHLHKRMLQRLLHCEALAWIHHQQLANQILGCKRVCVCVYVCASVCVRLCVYLSLYASLSLSLSHTHNFPIAQQLTFMIGSIMLVYESEQLPTTGSLGKLEKS